jgi:hypothetical protein
MKSKLNIKNLLKLYAVCFLAAIFFLGFNSKTYAQCSFSSFSMTFVLMDARLVETKDRNKRCKPSGMLQYIIVNSCNSRIK